VISGVVLNVEVDQMKNNIPSVCDARHLVRCTPCANAETENTLSVLFSLYTEFLPDMASLGYICYSARAYDPNPLQCFRCQGFRHVAAVCRREIPQCENCAGGNMSTVGAPMQLGIRSAL
jgi:hypothetical protein